jgi:hypothetical protein
MTDTSHFEGFFDPETHFLCRGCRTWLPNKEIAAQLESTGPGLNMFGALFAVGKLVSGYRPSVGYLCHSCLQRKKRRRAIFYCFAIFIFSLPFIIELFQEGGR